MAKDSRSQLNGLAIMVDSTPPDAQIDHAAALTYWNAIDANVNGMLGGFPHISRIDLRGSANFLAKLRRQHGVKPGLLARGVDCGAGYVYLLRCVWSEDYVNRH
jgi:hypothetical protein